MCLMVRTIPDSKVVKELLSRTMYPQDDLLERRTKKSPIKGPRCLASRTSCLLTPSAIVHPHIILNNYQTTSNNFKNQPQLSKWPPRTPRLPPTRAAPSWPSPSTRAALSCKVAAGPTDSRRHVSISGFRPSLP